MAVGKMRSVDVVLSGHLLGSFLPDQGTQARDGLTVSTHGCQIIITMPMRIKKSNLVVRIYETKDLYVFILTNISLTDWVFHCRKNSCLIPKTNSIKITNRRIEGRGRQCLK